jgi:RHS repeat-associated protein
VALGDGTGTLQTQYTYEPFGMTTQTGVASTSSYKFTGREDDGSGLVYYRARYYQPRFQRFISEDPIGLHGGTNLYRYVSNDPVNLTDPFGLQAIPAPFPGPSIPFPLPPIAIPGSPQNQQAVQATAEALRQLQNSISQLLSRRQCGDEARCDEQFESDLNQCRSLPTPAARSRCYESANNRYGACRAGKPLPPLIRW